MADVYGSLYPAFYLAGASCTLAAVMLFFYTVHKRGRANRQTTPGMWEQSRPCIWMGDSTVIHNIVIIKSRNRFGIYVKYLKNTELQFKKSGCSIFLRELTAQQY